MNFGKLFIFSHALLLLLIVSIFLPGAKNTETNIPFLVAIGFIQLYYLHKICRRDSDGATDIVILIWGFLLLWEIFTTKLNMMHPVLVPPPENVFNVFATQYVELLHGLLSSMQLLLTGFSLGIGLGVFGGIIVGWIPRLSNICFPVAQVLTPISPVIYAPYLIAIMPTFRSASVLVIFLGIFWPTFLNIILRIKAIEQKILDSARALNVKGWDMIVKILLPYVLPGVVSGLKVTMTTSIMMLTFAEMMGATSGMGYYIINYTHYANYTNVVAGIIQVGIVVTILNKLVNLFQKNTIKWR